MIRTLLLGLALLLAVACLPAEAKQLPPGSWSGSCSGATVVGNVLTAQCRSSSGDKRWTSIDFTRCPGNAVANDQGYLVCDYDYNNGNNGNYNGSMPPGSWSQSCRNARMKNGELRADCQRMDGSTRQSSIDPSRCQGNAVANDNGNLVCERNGNNGRMPGGSWQQTCRNSSVQGGTLYASCQRSNGSWRDSSINYRQCSNNAVANDNGRLVCENDYNGGGGQMPGGSWQQTCRNSNVQGNTLYASCQKMNGGWRDTSINYRQCNNWKVANDNGQLVCESDYNGGGGQMPGGSWQQTCRNSYVQGNTLYASCQRRDGGWRDSSLNYRQCNNNKVANDNGRLICQY
ncbi:MAG: CVNH domain-containing protein [Dongiaceae bacterium]